MDKYGLLQWIRPAFLSIYKNDRTPVLCLYHTNRRSFYFADAWLNQGTSDIIYLERREKTHEKERMHTYGTQK